MHVNQLYKIAKLNVKNRELSTTVKSLSFYFTRPQFPINLLLVKMIMY